MKDSVVNSSVKGQKAHGWPKVERSQSVPGNLSKQELEKKKRLKYRIMQLKKCAQLSSKKELNKCNKPKVSSTKELMKVRKTVKEICKIPKQTLPSSTKDPCKVSSAGPSHSTDVCKVENHKVRKQSQELSGKKSNSSKALSMGKPSAAAEYEKLEKHKHMEELGANIKKSSKQLKSSRACRRKLRKHNLQMKEVYSKKTSSGNELCTVGKPTTITDHTLYETHIQRKERYVNETNAVKEQTTIRNPNVGTDSMPQRYSQDTELSPTENLSKYRNPSTYHHTYQNNQVIQLSAEKTDMYSVRKPIKTNFSVPQTNKINEVRAKETGFENSTQVNQMVMSSAIERGRDDRTRRQMNEPYENKTWKYYNGRHYDRIRETNRTNDSYSNIRDTWEHGTNYRVQNEKLQTCNDATLAIEHFGPNRENYFQDMKNRNRMQARQKMTYNTGGQMRQYGSRKFTPTCTVTSSCLEKNKEPSLNNNEMQRPCYNTYPNTEYGYKGIGERFQDNYYYRNYQYDNTDSHE